MLHVAPCAGDSTSEGRGPDQHLVTTRSTRGQPHDRSFRRPAPDRITRSMIGSTRGQSGAAAARALCGFLCGLLSTARRPTWPQLTQPRPVKRWPRVDWSPASLATKRSNFEVRIGNERFFILVLAAVRLGSWLQDGRDTTLHRGGHSRSRAEIKYNGPAMRSRDNTYAFKIPDNEL